MNRERVAGYRRLCRSIEILDRRIEALERGAAMGQDERQVAALRADREGLAAERAAVRRFVDELRRVDEEVWQIVEMYYMSREKPTLQAVAMRMGWQSEFAPRYRLKQFFARMERVEGEG